MATGRSAWCKHSPFVPYLSIFFPVHALSYCFSLFSWCILATGEDDRDPVPSPFQSPDVCCCRGTNEGHFSSARCSRSCPRTHQRPVMSKRSSFSVALNRLRLSDITRSLARSISSISNKQREKIDLKKGTFRTWTCGVWTKSPFECKIRTGMCEVTTLPTATPNRQSVPFLQ